MDIYTQTKPHSTIKIFQEAIKLLAKRTLILPIFSIYLFSQYILYYFNHRVLSPLLVHLTLTLVDVLLSKTREIDFYVPIQKDIREIIIVESIFNIISFVISCIFTFATIHVLYEPNLTFKDVISKLRRTFKGPFITNLYIGIFSMGYTSLALSSFVFLFLFYSPDHSKVGFTISFIVQALILLILLSYLAIVWQVSVVVSVVQEGCYGLVAIGKAAKLVRGRRKQGTMIVFIQLVVILAMQGAYFKIVMDLYRSPKTQFAVGFVFIGVTLVVSMIVWATIMVFYNECMGLNGKNIEVGMEGNRVYKPLRNSNVDEVSSKHLIEDKC